MKCFSITRRITRENSACKFERRGEEGNAITELSFLESPFYSLYRLTLKWKLRRDGGDQRKEEEVGVEFVDGGLHAARELRAV